MKEETVTLTISELELRETVAVEKAKLEILVSDFQASRDTLFDRMAMISTQMNELPQTILECKDDLKKEIHTESDKKFVTHSEMRGYKNKIVGAVWAVGALLAVVMTGLEFYNVYSHLFSGH